MITHAEISHFKSVADVRIDLGPVNIIVGPNGSGKSNVVDALYFIHDCVTQDIDSAVTKRHGIDSVRQWSRTRPYHIVIDLHFSDGVGSGRYKMVLASARGTFRVFEEGGQWAGPSPFRQSAHNVSDVVTSSFHRSENGDVSIKTDFQDVQTSDPVRIAQEDLYLGVSSTGQGSGYILFYQLMNEIRSFSAYSIYPNVLRQAQIVSRELTLSDDGSNLTTVLRSMNRGSRKEKGALLESLRVVLPIVSDIIIKSAGGFYVPVLRVREPNGDLHDLNMSQVSDGTLRLLGLLTAFYQSQAPRKIIIEEPEQMIHPGMLAVITEAARDYVSESKGVRDRQLFMTTHSPQILDLFDPHDVKWTNFKNGVTECGSIQDRHIGLIKDRLFSSGEVFLAEGFAA